MTLDLYFWADSEDEARQQADAWVAAEPTVESGHIEAARPKTYNRWCVTVRLTVRPKYETLDLGLA